MFAIHACAKKFWCHAQDALVRMADTPCLCGAQPRLYYGGARAGHAGGPQVKVGLLKSRFPEHLWRFNLVYLSSGALYLSRASHERLQFLGIPLVVNQNGVFFPAWYPGGWEKENERLGFVLEKANHVFFQSGFCRRAVEKFVGVTPRSSEILYNAVDTRLFAPASPTERKARPLRLLLTGNVGKSQAQRLLSVIEGVAHARRGGLDVVLDVYGAVAPDVLTQAALLQDHYRLPGEIIFCGPYDRLQAPSVYRSADIYVTNKVNDNCPNAVLEAMASGLPTLYAASGGVPELVGEQAGVALSVPESFEQEIYPDPQAFAEGLEKLVPSRIEMGAAARQRACATFDVSLWLDRHAEVFARCLEGCG